jgi:hypothetical protein
MDPLPRSANRSPLTVVREDELDAWVVTLLYVFFPSARRVGLDGSIVWLLDELAVELVS